MKNIGQLGKQFLCRPTNIEGTESKNQVNFYLKNQVFAIQEMPKFTKNSRFYITLVTLTFICTTKYTHIHCRLLRFYDSTLNLQKTLSKTSNLDLI